MTIEIITSLITNTGFPIASFLIASYFIKYIFDKNNETMNTTMATLTSSIDKLKEAVDDLIQKVGDSK